MSEAPSPLSSITEAHLRDALRSLRFAKPLAGSPLLGLSVLDARLANEGLADTVELREWLLGQLLVEVVRAGLAGARGVAPDTLEERALEDFLEEMPRDFRPGEIDREAWSMLYLRQVLAAATPNPELAERLGVTKRTLMRRMSRGYALVADELRRMELAEPRPGGSTRKPAPRTGDAGAQGSEDLGPPTEAERLPAATRAALDALLAEVLGRPGRVALGPDALRLVAQHGPLDLRGQRLARVATWSLPRHRIDERFVELTLLLDRGAQGGASRWRAEAERYDDLLRVMAEVQDPALVLLGPPGAGKSSLLQHLELDLCLAGLRGEIDRVSLYVPLGGFMGDGGPPPSPRAWLAEAWRRRYPRLPGLEELLAAGRVVLLLDALNEMPHRGLADYREGVALWKRFLLESIAGTGNRAVFTCRSLDYSAPLSTPDLRVPQVRVEPLSDARMRSFLARHAPGHAEEIWASLEGTPQSGLLRSPYFLRLLVEQFEHDGRVPEGRAALITGFLRRAMEREVARDHPALAPGMALAERDVRRLASARTWRDAYELPERGPLVPALTELAYQMQAEQGAGEEAIQLRVPFDEALDLLGEPAHAQQVIDAGLAIGVLDEDRDRDELMFFHQLLQEYFAARRLAGAPEPERCRVPWRREDLDLPDVDLIATIGPGEVLPALPASGWEETARMAAAMAESPEGFVQGLRDAQLALAGQCAAQPEVRARIPAPRLDELRDALLARASDPEADLRARVRAGLALGELGDPRLPVRAGPEGAFVAPDWVPLPGGAYPIGDDEPVRSYGMPNDSHTPRREVRLRPFALARFEVTNAEWALFMDAGGYDDERWWRDEAARRWREGEDTAQGAREAMKLYWQRHRRHPESFDERYRDGGMTERQYRAWRRRLSMTEDEIDAHFRQLFPGGRVMEPAHWRDADYNRPTQPVVGISWFEAKAYAAWMAAQTGGPVRLPLEAEWEAAARGREGRTYVYGDAYLPLAANDVSTHLFRTTPIGTFPASASPEGIGELLGNVFEWTETDPEADPLIGPPPGAPAGEIGSVRAVRSSGFNGGDVFARAYFRHFGPPGDRQAILGFRLAAPVEG